MRIREVRCGEPGTLSMISARSANAGVALTLAEIAASSLAILGGQVLQDAGMGFPTALRHACSFWLCKRILQIEHGFARFHQCRSSSRAAS
jgi:transposase